MEEIQVKSEPKKIFGLNWFGGDSKPPESPYFMDEVRLNLRIRFGREYVTAYQFHEDTMRKIQWTNQQMGEERIKTNGCNLAMYLPNDIIYTIECLMYEKTWKVYKGYTHFLALHAELYTFADKFKSDTDPNIFLPSPPMNPPDRSGNQQEYLEFGNQLSNFLNQLVCGINNPKRVKLIMNFLGVSRPFIDLKYSKIAEFYCEKQSQGRLNDGWISRNVKSMFRRWQTRWLILTPNSLCYYENAEEFGNTMRDCIPFDNDTIVLLKEFSNTNVKMEFLISRRTLLIEVSDILNGLIALHNIEKVFRFCSYTKIQRFKSFAPIRERNDCMFFPDGEGYFFEVFNAIQAARSEVYITDWWFSPELPLMRPTKNGIDMEMSRIDRTLERAAQRGVRVYVIVYKEFKISLNNDSEHAKNALEKLHPNIKVLRHPNIIVSLWSHHEKMVLVDKHTVFMGGLDLCWGRYDYQEHPLFNDPNQTYFPGADYYNPLKKDISQGRQYQKSMIDQNYPRMPWHDVAVMLRGRIALDFAAHFNSYWNHARETNSESEVLFSARTGQRTLGSAKGIVSIPEMQPGEELAAVDAYESNPGANSENIKRVAAVNATPDPTSFTEPQVELHSFLQQVNCTENGKYTVDFLEQQKKELDRLLLISESNRTKLESEARIDRILGANNGPSATDFLSNNADSLLKTITQIGHSPHHIVSQNPDDQVPFGAGENVVTVISGEFKASGATVSL